MVSLAGLPPALLRAENDYTTVLGEIFGGVIFCLIHVLDKQRKSWPLDVNVAAAHFFLAANL